MSKTPLILLMLIAIFLVGVFTVQQSLSVSASYQATGAAIGDLYSLLPSSTAADTEKMKDLQERFEAEKEGHEITRQELKKVQEERDDLKKAVQNLSKDLAAQKESPSVDQTSASVASKGSQKPSSTHPCINDDFQPPKNKIAIFTFLTDMGIAKKKWNGKRYVAPPPRKKPMADYTYGAATLLKSIHEFVSSPKVDTILMEIPNRPLAPADRAFLQNLGWNFCTVQPIESVHTITSRFIDQFNKLHMWNFEHVYEKIVYMDSDNLVVNNITDLLESDLPVGKSIGVTQDFFGQKFVKTFNMGVFFIRPNQTEAKRLQTLQSTNAVEYTTHQAEQGFLNVVYKSQWHEIGFKYNANMAVFVRKAREKHWPSDPRILHFTLAKPWQEDEVKLDGDMNASIEFLDIWKNASRRYGIWNYSW